MVSAHVCLGPTRPALPYGSNVELMLDSKPAFHCTAAVEAHLHSCTLTLLRACR